MDLVVVYRTFDLAQAQLMRSRLEGAGFEAELEQENSAANLDVAVGGVRVVVPSDRAEEAKAFLEEPAE
jgi:hypothetical protein